jgi:protoporphyrin/coproporphyrin ferrochelatase
MENRQRFLKSGGRTFSYVPALNASDGHVRFLADLISQHAQGWVDTGFEVNASRAPRGTSA